MIRSSQKGFTRQNFKQVSGGFTLVELMLAMAFFSFILLFVTTGFLIVNRAYNKGLTVKLVQDEGRKLIENLTREVRTSNSQGIVTADGNTQRCIELNGNRYHWSVPISGVTGSPGNLYWEEGKKCTDTINVSSPAGVQVLDDRVGVQFISLSRLSASTPVYTLKIVLSTAETDLLDGEGAGVSCKTDSGNQYCDIVEFNTVVTSR